MLISAGCCDWLEKVYVALVRNDHMMLVWENTGDCGFVVAPAEGETYREFIAGSFRDAIRLVENGSFSLLCTPRNERDLGVELAEILGDDADGASQTDWTIVTREDAAA